MSSNRVYPTPYDERELSKNFLTRDAMNSVGEQFEHAVSRMKAFDVDGNYPTSPLDEFAF